MPDEPLDESPPTPPSVLSEEVGVREVRKIRARSSSDRTLWLGLGMFGLVGWSIVVPTLIGVGLGLWIDRNWPGDFSWSLALLLAGVTVGCLNAWYWVSYERRAIDDEEEETHQ